MEEHQHPTHKKGISRLIRRNRDVTLRMNRDLLTLLIAFVLIVAAYFVGVNNGEKNATKTMPASRTSQTAPSATMMSNRWTSVGTVQEVSDKAIKVKDSRGETKDAAITKETSIVDRKGSKLSTKDLKKDQRVIVSGTKDGDKLTATRIRIQQ